MTLRREEVKIVPAPGSRDADNPQHASAELGGMMSQLLSPCWQRAQEVGKLGSWLQLQVSHEQAINRQTAPQMACALPVTPISQPCLLSYLSQRGVNEVSN